MADLKTVDENLKLGPKMAPYKMPQFWPYFDEIWSLLSTHEMVILTKFHKIMTKNVDFSLVANLNPSRKCQQSLLDSDLLCHFEVVLKVS